VSTVVNNQRSWTAWKLFTSSSEFHSNYRSILPSSQPYFKHC